MAEAGFTNYSSQTFQFNFPNTGHTGTQENLVESPAVHNESNQDEMKAFRGSVPPTKVISPSVDEVFLKGLEEESFVLSVGSHVIKYVSSSSVFKKVSHKSFDERYLEFDGYKSDLIPGIYEGGFKVWECAIDLACYLWENQCIQNAQTVLELGCGAGIPGIISYMSGCKVTFQDYNAEVLELSTIPNVYMNTPGNCRDKISERCTFLSGDWKDITLFLQDKEKTDEKYDMIITSETIYEKTNHIHLLNLMKCCLKSSGVIYLAAKSYYFGVGGTIDDFQFLVERDGTFDCHVVHEIQEGVQRKIIQLQFKSHQDKTHL